MRSPRRRALAVLALAAALLVLAPAFAQRRARRCPSGMASIDGAFCIDRWEASLVEVLARGRTRAWSPFLSPERERAYRAVSRPNVLPQGYLSQVQARAACERAGRRLCSGAEWQRACRGPQPTQYPYGPERLAGRCNDDGVNPVPALFGRGGFHSPQMNDPRLLQQPRTVVRTGSRRRCTNRYGVHDMMGNLHEWTDERSGALGVFRGGYFADTHLNGDGCAYATRAHAPTYHDYSTGFRCCSDR